MTSLYISLDTVIPRRLRALPFVLLACRPKAGLGWQAFPPYTLPDCPPGHAVAKSGCFKVSPDACDEAPGKSSTGWPVSNLPLTQAEAPGLSSSATASGQEGADYRAPVCSSSIKTADVGEQKAQRGVSGFLGGLRTRPKPGIVKGQ